MNTISKQRNLKNSGEFCLQSIIKKNNWINLSYNEKRHISINFKEFFSSSNYGSFHNPEDFTKLHVTVENRKFNTWVPRKDKIIQILESFAVTIDFNESKEILDFARYYPPILFYADCLLDSKSFALEALSINQRIFPLLNNKLRDNESIVRAAITTWKSKQNFKLMRYASDRLKSSKKFMKSMIQTHPCLFTYLNPKLSKDRELINIFKSKTHLIKTVSDLNGLPAIERAEAFKNLYSSENSITGISFSWLKRQPKVIREDKLICFLCFMQHRNYSPFLFPRFEVLKERFKETRNFKDVIKYYLLALFYNSHKLLKNDDLDYQLDALIPYYYNYYRGSTPQSAKETSPVLVLDNIFECLGSEGFIYSQTIDFTEAFSAKAFDFYELVNKEDVNNTIEGLQDFYSFVDVHNNFNLFEKALLKKETIPSQEFNCTEISEKDRNFERNKSWFENDSLRALKDDEGVPYFYGYERTISYNFNRSF